MFVRLNRMWKHIFILMLTLTLGFLTFGILFRETLNEIPDRWHFPLLNPEPASLLRSPTEIFKPDPKDLFAQHPIHHLIAQATARHKHLLERQTDAVGPAAQAYRGKRGRHPPPGFDQWVAFAKRHDCIVIEEMFDRIYHDLNPFWGVPPETLHADVSAAPSYIRIRDGKAYRTPTTQPFMDSYFDLIQQIETYLPDLDIPINHMDEPRVLVPWEDVAQDMKVLEASLNRQDLGRPPIVATFTTSNKSFSAVTQVSFAGDGRYWNYLRQACSPDTGARALEMDADFSTPPEFPQSHSYGTYKGYVQNWTTSQDVCRHPHLRNMHGTFIEPISISTSSSLTPMFSGSKLLANNDILLPAAMYWTDGQRFAASKNHISWDSKRNEVFWRGTASGGRNKANNWTRFQRHRLVSMLNGTQIMMTLGDIERNNDKRAQVLPHNFPLPDEKLYPLVSAKLSLLAEWVRSFSNVAFYWLECFPSTRDYACPYSGSWYRRGRPVTMERMFLNKYLPDIDGNSFSGRFRAFMMSNSLPIKASIYAEWHDSRLIPWKHFVPMDNTFVDLWSILEFFFAHDEKAERIAIEGREWADRVLRKEDMLVYVYRLLLEYARINDPNREMMGFGEDLST